MDMNALAEGVLALVCVCNLHANCKFYQHGMIKMFNDKITALSRPVDQVR